VKTIIEPFKIKTVEPINFTTREQREVLLKEAGYNPFSLASESVIIDLMTDSGTSAMSAAQWGGIMQGDESYAGASSFARFEKAVKEITGMKHVIPTHQGRAAERILFGITGGEGKVIPNNTHFDTTRANVEVSGAKALDLPCPEGGNPALIADFKGNMDIKALEDFLEKEDKANIPLGMITVTNNSGGGQPVSMENIRQASELFHKHGIPFFIDACRFAENAYFIKKREPGYESKSIKEIAQEMFSYADGCTMSAKKDALVNMGGFLALNDDALAQEARNILVVTEGFPTYGGLAGRDLEAIAIGLEEVLEEDYLKYRVRSMEYVGEKLTAMGIPLVLPTGGHAVFIDAKAFAPHIPPHQFPGWSLSCEMYLQGGIRSCEIGSVMFGRTNKETGEFEPSRMELVRMAVPRRVYTQSHMDYVVECLEDVWKNREKLRGMKLVYEAPVLRHFTARLDYV
jgi:tryptophanase